MPGVTGVRGIADSPEGGGTHTPLERGPAARSSVCTPRSFSVRAYTLHDVQGWIVFKRAHHSQVDEIILGLLYLEYLETQFRTVVMKCNVE